MKKSTSYGSRQQIMPTVKDLLVCALEKCWSSVSDRRVSQYSLSVLCHFVALADCIRSSYVGGQFVITRNILSFSFLHHNYNIIGSPCEFNICDMTVVKDIFEVDKHLTSQCHEM